MLTITNIKRGGRDQDEIHVEVMGNLETSLSEEEVPIQVKRIYDRHVFLCYKNPQVWPPHVEAAKFDRLPRLLSAALLARKAQMKKQTHLTISEGHDGTETSNGEGFDLTKFRCFGFDFLNFGIWLVDSTIVETSILQALLVLTRTPSSSANLEFPCEITSSG
ncbi:hypothetical protein GIB67_000030 [Kingdonia uniflora]|uniref:Uncharacterized protein n=1 Tax=Kingdonia uniflora TaxID=39325 RepID=A0A7J7MNN4_9MAGN|nr:hypothetical protein GIB67_000030 [Kingdonia uniflora]